MPNRQVSLRSLLRRIKHQWPFLYRPVIGDVEAWIRKETSHLDLWARRLGPWLKRAFEPEFVRSIGPWPGIQTEHSRRNLPSFAPIPFWVEPPAFLGYYQNFYVDSTDGQILTNRNEMLGSAYHRWGTKNSRARFRYHGFPRLVDVPGTSTVISCPGYDSHYHWLLQALPRLALVHPYLPEIDNVLVPHDLSQIQRDSLSWLGVPVTKLRAIGPGERYLCANLFVASLPGAEGAISQWALDYLRSRVAPKRGARTKVYLKRGLRRRRVVNESEVVAACQMRGFEIFDGESMGLSEQAPMLADAALVVGAHGGALSNIVFSREATVVEVFDPNHVVPDCFTHLAKRCGHKYFWTTGGDVHRSPNGDFAININHLNSVIDRVGVT